MKSLKIFAVAAGLLAIAACTKEQEIYSVAKLDESKPAVASFSYDDAASGATAAGFAWSADAALAAGATSFTLELTADVSVESVENASKFKVVDAPAVSYVMNGLSKGAFYYARIRANYPGFLYSKWTYLGSESNPMAVCVGTGVVDAKFGAPANLKATPTETSFKATWDPVPFTKSYVFEYKPASSGDWSVVGDLTATSYEVEGLVAQTTYDIRVKAVAADRDSDYTTGSVTTLEPSKFNPQMSKVNDLLEFFKTEAALASSANEYSLEADIDLSGQTIPTVDTFKGILDGKGHTIKGLALTDAIFKNLTGSVKNLTIEGELSKVISAEESAEGHPLAALAIISKGSVVSCVNKVNVSLTGSSILGSPVVAGLVAFQEGGEFSGNKNLASVSLVHGGTANVEIEGFNRKPFSVAAGLVGVVFNATVSDCENEGAISVSCTDVPKVSARHYIGGVIGTPENAVVRKCVNKGAISADFTDATKSAAKQVWVGGIIGGRNGDVKTVDGAFVEDCENYGDLTLIAENSVNNYLAGIGGQATVEATGSNYTADKETIQKLVNCHNHGKLVKKGAGGCRIGGISGGAATLENCSNSGEIVVENISTAGAVGGLVGYPTQPYHPVTGCKNTGNMTATCDVEFAMGGLFGQGGNTNQEYADCSVDCVITAPASVNAGAILGTAKTIASGKSIVYGSASAPFKVKGTVKGTVLDASNFKSLLIGDGGVTNGGVIDTENVVLQ